MRSVGSHSRSGREEGHKERINIYFVRKYAGLVSAAVCGAACGGRDIRGPWMDGDVKVATCIDIASARQFMATIPCLLPSLLHVYLQHKL